MNGRTVLITGASTGIGYELATLFAQDKWNLVLLARQRARLLEVSEQLGHTYGVQTQIVVADLSHPRVSEEVMMQFNETGTKIACLVNNAGFGAYGDFADLPLDEQANMIHTNVNALVELTHRLLPHIITVRGRILNVASTAAFQPGPHMAVYYATKAFVLSFSEALAEELAARGVHVSTLCPGPVPTEFQKRAGLEGTVMSSNPLMVEANVVAREAYEGLMKGKRLIIPGWGNKIGVQGQRFAPRRLVIKIAAALQKKKK